MNKRILIAVLVVLASVPAATAHMAPADSSPTTSAPASVSSVTEAADAEDDSSDEETNYTRLYVDADDSYLNLQPGESDSFTIRVKNGEDTAVDVNPHLWTSPVARLPMNESWVTIDGPDELAAGEEATYDVRVSVPSEAETGRYSGLIAFTDQTAETRAGQPERPVHADYVNVEVWRPPTVRIVSDTYVHTQVEAGSSVTRQIVIENTGDSAVPLSPELKLENRRCVGSHCPAELDPSWIDIDAPSQVEAGETATVTVTISPGADADRGDYRSTIDLGLKDPNRDPRNEYWQEVNLRFVVWQQPEEPYETSFTVSEGTENVTLTLNPRNYGERADGDAEKPGFDVTFVSPDGERIDAERVRVSKRGHVDLSGRGDGTEQGAYTAQGAQTEFVYALDEPASGEWSVEIMPENTISFSYELTRNESGDDDE